jgi:propanediol dehydratase small subunit
MSNVVDYPLGETHPGEIRALSGKPLERITLDAVLAGEVAMDDLAIHPDTLARQAGIARAAGRPTLAENFERAADLVRVPQEVVMRAYELLRPGRAKSADDIRAMAAELRDTWGAARIAAFLDEAADVYEARGLFRFRY